MNPNKVDAINSGYYDLTFKDGQKIRFHWPNVKIHGLLTKEPRYIFVEGFKVEDKENKLLVEANFNRTKGKSFMSWGKKKEEATNQVELKLLEDGKEVLTGKANYMKYVKWGDEVYWRFTDEALDVLETNKVRSLPSSSIWRTEIELIRERKFKEADKVVEKLEKEEDKDHLIREKAKKPQKKGWFK